MRAVALTPVFAPFAAWLVASGWFAWLRPARAAELAFASTPVPTETAAVARREAVLLRRRAARRRARIRRLHLAELLRVRALRASRVALREVGVPYVWGGDSPSGFDCSGLVEWAYRRVGVVLPRTTYAMLGVGRAVRSLAAIRPGDLLFPEPGHVLMALGHGLAVEAPHTGTTVRVTPFYSGFVAIRRVV